MGCGKIGEKHAEAYRALGETDVIVYDVDPERAKSLSTRFGFRMSTTFNGLLADSSVDLVDVCVPTFAHKEIILEALAAGKHVFSEKPLCETLRDAYEIYEAAERNRCMVGVGYPLRFYPAMQLAKDIVSRGVIGKPHLVLMRIGGRGSAAVWKHRLDQGGGAISEMLVHLLDLVVWLFGTMDEASLLHYDTILDRRLINEQWVEVDAEDVALVRLSRPGLVVICESDLCTPGYMQLLEIQGDNGSLMASLLDYIPTTLFCKEPVAGFAQGRSHFTFPATNVFEQELRQFLERVRRPDGWNDIVNSLNVARLFEQLKSQQLADRRFVRPRLEVQR